MNYDLVYQEIGELGLFQKYIILLNCLPNIYVAFMFFNSFFYFQIPKHRCAIPGYPNDTFAVQSPFHELLVNRSIPLPSDTKLPYDECHVIPPGDYLYGTDNRPVNASSVSCDRWVYDRSVFEETLASKFDIVCDRKIYKSNAQMIFFAGVFTGSLVSGILADRFGRKTVHCASMMILIGVALAIAWTPNYIYYVIFNFLSGALAIANYLPKFVLAVEYAGPTKRKYAGLVGVYVWVVGQLLLSWMGYSIRNWFWLQLACALPIVVYIPYWWLLPESPRWLFSVGRLEESERITKLVAKYNKKELPPGFFNKISQDRSPDAAGKIWHLFSTRTLCIRTLVVFFNWIAVCVAYYGLALNSGNLGGSVFLNFTLNAVVDLPALTITLLLLDRIGRKPFHVSCMLVGGVACLATIFTTRYGGEDLEALTITLALIGKIGAMAGFCTAYVYSAELFPTYLRNAGIGASSCMARIGGMVAPYIADMSNIVGKTAFGEALPMIVFGGMSVAAGILTFLLPETRNKHLPETIQDAHYFGRNDLEDEKDCHINKAYEDITGKSSSDSKP